MSLRSIDRAVKKKLQDAFQNVYFGPLARALSNSAQMDDLAYFEDELIDTTNGGSYFPNEVNNPVATYGAPNTISADDGYREVETNEDLQDYNNSRNLLAVKLPLIAFDRINNPLNEEWQGNFPMTLRGQRYVIPEIEEGRAIRFLPINPQYQIDVISDRRVEVDDLWREIMFYLTTQPYIHIIYESEEESEAIEDQCPIHLLDTDNTTDVESFDDTGPIYRQTISFEIRDCKLYFVKDTKAIRQIPLHFITTRR